MRILLLSQYFWPENFRINDLAIEWMRRGHEVTVLTGIPNYGRGEFYEGYGFWRPREQDYHGAQVVRVPLTKRGQHRSWRLALNYLSFAVSASLLGPMVLRRRFDGIFVYAPSPVTVGVPALILRWWFHVPMIFWLHDLWPESLVATGVLTHAFFLKVVERLVRWIYRHADRILIQSEGFYQRVQEVLARVSPAVDYVPFWAEDFYVPNAETRDEDVSPRFPWRFPVVFAGNLGSAQGLEAVLDAAYQLKDEAQLGWVFIGDGTERSHLEDLVCQLGLTDRVLFLGSRPAEEMPKYFSHAGALLVSLKRSPSLASTIPGKVQAYLACGRPIIAFLDGEAERIVREAGAGVRAPAEDVPALVCAIRELLRMSSNDLARMGTNAREYYERVFGRDQIMNRIETICREVFQK